MISVSLAGVRRAGQLLSVSAAVVSLKVSGHAGCGVKGEDIVCAAVSTLVQTAVKSIAVITAVEQHVQVNNGFLSTDIMLDGTDSSVLHDVVVILETLVIGLEEIAVSSPGCVEINYF